MKKIEIGARYKHYKGKYYRVICIAKHSETLEDLVIYEKLYDGHNFWARPKKMFLETVKIPARNAESIATAGGGNKKVARFAKINQKIVIKPSKNEGRK